MPRTLVQRVGQGSASLLALVLWCSSCNGLIGGMMMGPGKANYFRDYKRLGPIAKLATSYATKYDNLRDLQHDPHAVHLLLLPRVQSTIELDERDDIICRLFCQAYKHFYSIAGIFTIRLILLTRFFTFSSC